MHFVYFSDELLQVPMMSQELRVPLMYLVISAVTGMPKYISSPHMFAVPDKGREFQICSAISD
jgi:hypothetical protein